MLAQDHPQNAERLAALRSYGILDTPRESDFDAIVALASRICDMPISLISLVESDRQWFKAEVGFGETQTRMDQSICSHAILSEAFLEIPDTLADPRTAQNPLCQVAEGVRFYAGAVLRTSQGLPIGTLCVLDKQPRRLTPLQVETLRVLAAQVMVQLELRLALRRQDALRRESDHRVKNSLTAIAALVRIQARSAATAETRDALLMVRQRIDTVAALHGLLYRSELDGAICLSAYLGQVAALLDGSAPAQVTITVDADPVQIAPEVAGSLAMVVNELCTNAFKHAFPGDRPGTITVTGRASAGQYVLTCADDGVGLPASGAVQGGIGNAIIEASVAQIGGALAVLPGSGLPGPGLTVQVTVPV